MPNHDSAKTTVGFTLIETVIATALAAIGFTLVFQGLSGAVRLTNASHQTEKAVLVAKSIIAQSMVTPPEIGQSQGIADGVAWTLSTSLTMQNDDGMKLVRYDVLAQGSFGRQVHLTSERVTIK